MRGGGNYILFGQKFDRELFDDMCALNRRRSGRRREQPASTDTGGNKEAPARDKSAPPHDMIELH
jgi:hypothetical protein